MDEQNLVGYRCTICFNYVGPKLKRHLESVCMRTSQSHEREERRQAMMSAQQKAKACFVNNLFFDPGQLEDRQYTLWEVTNIMENYGHAIVPENVILKSPVEPCKIVYDFMDWKLNYTGIRPEEEPMNSSSSSDRSRNSLFDEDKYESSSRSTKSARTPLVPLDDYSSLSDSEADPDWRPGKKRAYINSSSSSSSSSNSSCNEEIQNVSKSARKKVCVRDSTDDEGLVSQFPSTLTGAASSLPVQKKRASTSTVKKKLQKKGFYDVSEDYKDLVLFKQFKAWYELRAPENMMNNNTMNVIRMTFTMNGGQDTFETSCLNKDNYLRVIEMLTDYGVSPKTLANYGKSMKAFITFLRKDSTANLVTNRRLKEFYKQLCRIQDTINGNVREIVVNQIPDEIKNPSQVTKILQVARKQFEKSMKSANDGDILGRNDVSIVNSYIACYLCLSQGHSPVIPNKITIDDYKSALRHGAVEIEGEGYISIGVNTHCVMLNSYWRDIFSVYYKSIRVPIRTRTGSIKRNFLLQNDGNAFNRVQQGIEKIQRKFGIQQPVTATDAKKSIEAYIQSKPQEMTSTKIIDLLRTTERDSAKTSEIQKTPTKSQINSKNNPKVILEQIETTTSSHSKTQDLRPRRSRIPTTGTSAPTTGKSTPSPRTPQPTLSPHTPQSKLLTEQLWKELVCAAGGNETYIKVFNAGEIIERLSNTGNPITSENAKILQRKLRHLHYTALAKDIARMLLNRECKRKKTKMENMTCDDIPAIKNADLIHKVANLKIKRGSIVSEMSQMITDAAVDVC